MFLLNRILFSSFEAHNLLLHLPNFITSGISILILINFTIIETLLPLYTLIRNVSPFFKPTPLHPTKNSHTMRYIHIYSIDCWLDELFLIKFYFYSTVLYSSNMSFSHHICCRLILETITIASLTRTHNWIGFLHDWFWLFWIVCSNYWNSDFVLLIVSELHI